MSNSLSYKSLSNRNRGGRMRWPLIVFIILVLITLFVTGGALFTEERQTRKNMPTATPTITPTPTPTPEISPTPTPRNSSKPTATPKEIASGPYGYWEPTLSPTPTMVIPPGTEIWMEGWEDPRTPFEAKGIYVSKKTIASEKATYNLVDLIERTELNAVIIDIKEDYGTLVYDFDNPLFDEYKSINNVAPYLPKLIEDLHSKGIYAIARIVSFKDPVLAKSRPELALYNKNGKYYKDNTPCEWVSPFKQEVWNYLLEIGKACAAIGFDEINYDYMRFPTDNIENLDYGPEHATKTVIECITEGVKFLCENLRMEGVYISADVYGAIIGSAADTRVVGQDYVQLIQYLDYICPMIYPSHYAYNWRNFAYPDKEPYGVILQALKESNAELAKVPAYRHCGKVRPWLQDFTADYLGTDKKTGVQRYITYDAVAVRNEIQAVYDSGNSEWLLWNAASVFTEGALLPE